MYQGLLVCDKPVVARLTTSMGLLQSYGNHQTSCQCHLLKVLETREWSDPQTPACTVKNTAHVKE